MLKKNQYKTWILKGISLFFIILFTYAAVSKLINLNVFHLQLEQSPFIALFAGWLVWVVPVIQIVIALMFFSTRFRSSALFLSFFLMIFFSFYIFAVLNFAQSIPCSCGGIISSWTWSQHLIFNICVISIAIIGIVLSQKEGIRAKNYHHKKNHLNFLKYFVAAKAGKAENLEDRVGS